MKETFVHLHDVAQHNPVLTGLPFNIIDYSQMLPSTLYNRITSRKVPRESDHLIMSAMRGRDTAMAYQCKSVAKMHECPLEKVLVQHMLTRVIHDPLIGDYQVFCSVAFNSITDMIMAYRPSPLRLLLEKDGRSWKAIEQLVERLDIGEKDQELLGLINLNIISLPSAPKQSPSYRQDTTAYASSA